MKREKNQYGSITTSQHPLNQIWVNQTDQGIFSRKPHPTVIMTIISWNIHVINSNNKQRFIRNCLKEEQLNISLLQETKCKEDTTPLLLKKCWNNLDTIAIDAQGFSRGMAITWNRSKVNMTQLWTTKGTIIGNFDYFGTSVIGYVTNVYRSHQTTEKLQLIDDLNHCATLTTGSHWIVGGNYKMIKSLEEKK